MSRPRFLLLVLLGSVLSHPGTATAQPPTPASCAAGPGTYAGTSVTWSEVGAATGYRLYRDGTLIAVLPTGQTDHLDLDVATSGSFQYCVEAFDGVGASAPCCAVRIVPTPPITVERKHWYHDCFPANETIVPPNLAALDTAAAWIRTGLNLAQLTGSSTRQDLPGDTVVCDAPGEGLRVDLVFRVLPGVGNYVQVGNRATALRRVPTSTISAAANAGSTNFWESYLGDNGAVGTGGNGASGPGHPGGVWSADVWNSARCDTAETNVFPTESRLANLPGLAPGRYASMIHESDPKFSTLGVAKNRCFLVDPSGGAPINSTNISCGTGPYPPLWAQGPTSGLPATEGGLPQGQSREFTQIIPDGQLTPGSHVQYFLRSSDSAAPFAVLGMTPDTNVTLPQIGGSLDGKRWEDFGVLPDRWKDPAFGAGGTGMACLLVLNFDTDDGNQRAFDGVADSSGATSGFKSGAHNGLGRVPRGADPNDPAYFVRAHRGQAGTTWDLYRVRGSGDTLTGNAGAPGGRLAPRCAGCPAEGRESRQGPTPAVLRSVYRAVMVLSGDRDALILGPTTDRGQDDVALLQDFLSFPSAPSPRGVSVMGSGFTESEQTTHPSFLNDYLGAELRAGDYAALSGNTGFRIGVQVAAMPVPNDFVVVDHDQPGAGGQVLDVLDVNTAIPEAVAHTYYDDFGSSGPYVAAVRKDNSALRPWEVLLSGWDIEDFGAPGIIAGRARYFIYQPYAAGGCAFPGTGGLDVEEPARAPRGLWLTLRNNPVSSGAALLRVVLPEAGPVRLSIHDVSGRLVRVLVDGWVEAGTHEATWNGLDARGQRVAGGVYFARARFDGGVVGMEKIVVLK